MNPFEANKKATVLIGVAIATAAFLLSYLLMPTLIAQRQPQGVELIEARLTPLSVKSSQPATLTVRIANNLNENVNVTVLISINGDVEKYVNVTGFNIEKVSKGLWLWRFGVMPPSSEVKYVAKLIFSIPSGIAEIKYRVHVDYMADDTLFESEDFIIKVSS